MRSALKLGTRQIHDEVDAAFSTLDLAVYEDYSVFLNAHFLGYSALAGCRLNSVLSEQIGQIRASIAEDLRSLDAVGAPVKIEPGLPELHPIGVGYVLGGSHFGKRVLRKRWSKSADTRVLAAHHYFETPLLDQVWKSVVEELNAPHQINETRIVDTAIATFRLFRSGYAHARASARERSKRA